MTIRVIIDDLTDELCITIRASGSYSPDVVDDLRSRALDTYRQALVDKRAITTAAEKTTD